jgi:hypothetical protein
MTTSNRDFVLVNGLQIGGYLTSVNGSTPSNGQLLIGDATNGRFSLGTLASTNGLTVSNSAGGISITSNATNLNSASTIVARDASGNFSAGTITGNLTGVASSATVLATPRTINGVAFDGSANISFTTDAVPEGTTNLYFTNARVSGAAPVQSVFGRTGTVVLTSPDVTGALGYTPINPSTIGANGGLATLDVTGKVPLSELPAAIVGGLNFKGTWDASINSPTLVSSTGTNGAMYKVATAGTTAIDGISQWNVGDIIVFDGTTWDKIDGISSEVVSVFGRTGAVVLQSTDVITALGSQTKNTFLAAPTAANGAVTFRGISASDLPLATASTIGGVSVSTGLTVTAGVLTANVVTVAGRSGAVVLNIADVTGAAPLASPVFTGNPTAPTPVTTDNDTSIATTAFVNNALASAGLTPGGGTATFNGPIIVKQATIDTSLTSTADTNADVIYSVAVTGASTAKFLVQVVDASNNMQSEEVIVITDATNTWLTSYGIVLSNGSLGSVSAQVTTGNLQLVFTSITNTAKTIKVAVISLTQ